MAGCCHKVCGQAKRKKAPCLREDSSNVDKALTRTAQAKARLIRSGFKHLIWRCFLVAGVGFEPTTFRL